MRKEVVNVEIRLKGIDKRILLGKSLTKDLRIVCNQIKRWGIVVYPL